MAFKDIRKSQPFLTPADIAFILGALILGGGLLALNIHLARTFGGGEWLFQRWSAARVFLSGGSEPYGLTIAEQVQNLVYGREAFLNEYPYVLNDPFYIVLLYVPLALFRDFAVAQGIWLSLSQAALIGIVTLSMRLIEWEPPRWMVVLLVMFGLFGYFSFAALRSASPAIFLTLLYLLILVALRSDADELAGALLCLAAYHWETGALFFLFALVFVAAYRRWSAFTGFGMTLIVLVLISLLAKSGWVLDYLRAARYDWNRAVDYTFAITLAYIFPRFTLAIERWLTVIVVGVLFYEAVISMGAYFRHLVWAAFLALALNPLLGFAIFPAHHVVLLPGLILVLALVWERWNRRRVLAGLLVLVLIMLLPYGLFYQTLQTQGRLYADLLKILPPALALALMYWMRWWAIRPPRIWADRIGTGS